MSYDEQPDDIHGECALEIKRLEEALRYEENRFSRIGTHSDVCWAWGPSHYECAMRHALELKNQIIAKDAEIAMLRTGDTCGRQCEGTAYRIELRQVKAEIVAKDARIAELRYVLSAMVTYARDERHAGLKIADDALARTDDLSALAEHDRQVRRAALLDAADDFEMGASADDIRANAEKW